MRKVVIISLFLFSLAAAAYPQEEARIDLEGLTLDEATSIALSNSVELRKTAITIRDNETRLSEETVWRWLSPDLSLRGGVDTETGEPRLTLGVSIDLDDVMGAGNKRIRTLRFAINEDKKNLKALEASLRVKVAGAYRECMAAREKVKAIEDTLGNDEKLLTEVEAAGSRTDLLLIRSIINQDRLALLTARQEFERAEMGLRELLGATPPGGN